MAPPPIDWTAAGQQLAERLLSSGVSAFQLSDLHYRFGVLVRHLGPQLAALGAPRGDEARVPGMWVNHLDGTHLYLTRARMAAENSFNAGWDFVVEAALRERTRNQRLPGEGGLDGKAPDFLVTLGLERSCTVEDVKRAFKERALGAHPDVGGDHDLFVVLSRARDEALAFITARDARSRSP